MKSGKIKPFHKRIIEYIPTLSVPQKVKGTLHSMFASNIFFCVNEKYPAAKLTAFDKGKLKIKKFSCDGINECTISILQAQSLKIITTKEFIKRKSALEKLWGIKPTRSESISQQKQQAKKDATKKQVEERIKDIEEKEAEQRRSVLKKENEFLSLPKPKIKKNKPPAKNIEYSREKLGYAALQKIMRDSMPD